MEMNNEVCVMMMLYIVLPTDDQNDLFDFI